MKSVWEVKLRSSKSVQGTGWINALCFANPRPTPPLPHNALIHPVPYTDFDLLNLTSQTLFIVFLGLLSDIGETYTPCFVDYANTNTNTNTNTNR